MKTPQIPAPWSKHGQIEKVKPAAPANWYISSTAEDTQGLIYNETGQNIAVCYDPTHARLIAAAPELLEALKILENALTRNGSETIAVKVARQTARAAIQKATS